jgi:hypothetical protein
MKSPFQQTVNAVQGCAARKSATQVVDLSEPGPGMYRTRRAEKVHDGLFQHPANGWLSRVEFFPRRHGLESRIAEFNEDTP